MYLAMGGRTSVPKHGLELFVVSSWTRTLQMVHYQLTLIRNYGKLKRCPLGLAQTHFVKNEWGEDCVKQVWRSDNQARRRDGSSPLKDTSKCTLRLSIEETPLQDHGTEKRPMDQMYQLVTIRSHTQWCIWYN